jgi:hypothetical protein
VNKGPLIKTALPSQKFLAGKFNPLLLAFTVLNFLDFLDIILEIFLYLSIRARYRHTPCLPPSSAFNVFYQAIKNVGWGGKGPIMTPTNAE